MSRDHGLDLSGREAEQALEITDEPVHVPLARSLQDDVLVVIISHCTGHFLIIHLWFIFPHSPSHGDLIWVIHLELPSVPCPGDDVDTRLVCEELQQELPQLDGPGPGEAGARAGLWE